MSETHRLLLMMQESSVGGRWGCLSCCWPGASKAQAHKQGEGLSRWGSSLLLRRIWARRVAWLQEQVMSSGVGTAFLGCWLGRHQSSEYVDGSVLR